MTDGFGEATETQRCKVLTDFLGDELEEVDHELRLAGELGTKSGVLGGNADRAGVKMADPHHDAAADHQRAQ
jgi:hypothetical protein